jgi:hypothetical protein
MRRLRLACMLRLRPARARSGGGGAGGRRACNGGEAVGRARTADCGRGAEPSRQRRRVPWNRVLWADAFTQLLGWSRRKRNASNEPTTNHRMQQTD